VDRVHQISCSIPQSAFRRIGSERWVREELRIALTGHTTRDVHQGYDLPQIATGLVATERENRDSLARDYTPTRRTGNLGCDSNGSE